MGASLGLSYSQMGAISTVNFLGYLVFVLASGALAQRVGTRAVITASLAVVGVSMILVGRASGFVSIVVLYMLTGLGSGGANVPMMGLIAAWFRPRLRGRAAGFVVIGSGFAILLSGWMIPALNRMGGPEGWRLSWMVIGSIVLAVAGLCGLVLRNRPSELGLPPCGKADPAEEADGRLVPVEGQTLRKTVLHLGAIYFLFGFTYVIYVTFIVTVLVKERGFSEAAAGQFWSWVGLLSLFSGPVFGTLSDVAGRRAALVSVFAFQTAAYGFVAFRLPIVFLYLSIGLFGIVAWSIPSIMAALVADHVGPANTPKIFGVITFIFACGQMAGPAIAGALADASGSFATSFLMAAVGTTAAGALSLFLTPPRRDPAFSGSRKWEGKAMGEGQ